MDDASIDLRRRVGPRRSKWRERWAARAKACAIHGRYAMVGVYSGEASGSAAVVVSSDGAVTLCSTSQGAPLRGGFFPVLRVPLDPPRTQTHGILLVIAHHRLGVRGSTRLQGVARGVAGE